MKEKETPIKKVETKIENFKRIKKIYDEPELTYGEFCEYKRKRDIKKK